MDTNIKISVVIATYNGYNFIGKTIDSVLNQTYRNFEIIVVDDGSTDDRLFKVLKSYIDKKDITYIKKTNGGQGSARNLGVANSKGELIAFLDDDDFWDTNKLKKQIDLIEKSQDCVVCYSNTFLIKTDTKIYENDNSLYEGNVFKKLLFRNFITLSSSIVMKNKFNEVGGFSEEQELRRVEDYDLWLKLSRKGRFHCINEPLVYYRARNSLSSSEKVEEYKKLFKLFLFYSPNDFYYKTYYIFGGIIPFMKYMYFSLLK